MEVCTSGVCSASCRNVDHTDPVTSRCFLTDVERYLLWKSLIVMVGDHMGIPRNFPQTALSRCYEPLLGESTEPPQISPRISALVPGLLYVI